LPGAVIAIQTFGDLLGYNPHLHVLISGGCFHESGLLTVAPRIDTHALEQLFRHKILKLLLSEGRITEAAVALMAKWRHSGFSVYCSPRILPRQTTAMENLARYIIEEQEVIRKILTHLGLWQIKARPRPVAHAPPDLCYEPFNDWPAPSAEDYLTDPLYSDEV
jgi:hypothetical protein